MGPKRTLKMQVDEESIKVGLSSKVDTHCQSRWIVGINLIVNRLRCIRPSSLIGDAS